MLSLSPEQQAYLHAQRGHGLTAVIAILGVVATVAVVLRLLSAPIMKRYWGLDDVTIVVALVSLNRSCFSLAVFLTTYISSDLKLVPDYHRVPE